MSDEERVAEALRDASLFVEPMTFWRGIAATAIAAMGLVDDPACRDPLCSYRAERKGPQLTAEEAWALEAEALITIEGIDELPSPSEMNLRVRARLVSAVAKLSLIAKGGEHG